MSSSEDINAIQSQFTRIWRRVQVAYDDFTEERDTLDLSINDDINYLRQQIIPGTISDYKAIITELASINVSDPDLQKEKKVLVSICEYKIKLLEGLSAAYHAPQIEEYDLKKSLEEYKNAKYFFQDVLDIINVQGIGVSQYPEEKEPPYARKYWDYIYSDRETAKAYFKWANNNISRVAGLI